MDIYNIESVFTALELGNVIQRVPNVEPDEIDDLISSLKKVIAKTLECSIRFQVINSRIEATNDYASFVELIQKIRSDIEPKHDVEVITFNYDIALDYALRWLSENINYGLNNSRNGIPVYKLHGSLNWIRCNHCRQVVEWDIRDYTSKLFGSSFVWQEQESVGIHITQNLNHFEHCGKKDSNTGPVIIPPSWNKSDYHKELTHVWSKAADALSKAENIFIIGYSLPETDSFFRQLFALGTASETILKKIWVFNPDRSVETRFNQLIGSGVKNRFEFFDVEFHEAINLLCDEFDPQ